jgi:hypothetical protein
MKAWHALGLGWYFPGMAPFALLGLRSMGLEVTWCLAGKFDSK